jgi:hypothetical protein
MFSGSYDPADVTFLLKPVPLKTMDVAEKEWLIQSGQSHYSELISREALPSPVYLRVFHEAFAREKERFARDLLALAGAVAADRTGEIVLASLARAGTPVGVLLTRALRRHLARRATHYSLSIIRDRGLDEVALNYILERHPAEAVVFVDGWTGKGVIAGELQAAVTACNRRHGTRLDPGLYALADLCGAAVCASSAEDWLIPTAVLGATASGLVSRSILNAAVVGPDDFHGCLYYKEFAAHDLSRWLVDSLAEEIGRQARTKPATASRPGERERAAARIASAAFLTAVRNRFGVRSLHHVKPGLGEATRVLLRRVPGLLLVRSADLPEVAHLLVLAREKGVPVLADPALPYAAAALIKELDG